MLTLDTHEHRPAIDVLCPVFNHANYIEECLTSILIQEKVQVLIHVIDDASTDATLAIVSKIQEKYPQQVKIYSRKKRLGNAIQAIEQSQIRLHAKYWTYIEGDDFLVNKNKFISQIDVLEQFPELIATATQCIFWDVRNNLKKILKPDIERWNFHDLVMKKNEISMYSHISSIVWKSETQKSSEYFYPKSCESEVYMVHLLLKESQKYIEFQDIEGSCYRFTGYGVWSSLDEATKQERHAELQKRIDSITPLKTRIHRLLNVQYKKYYAKLQRLKGILAD
jgi:glycosyltransferase involved in cell wall biosynthesis